MWQIAAITAGLLIGLCFFLLENDMSLSPFQVGILSAIPLSLLFSLTIVENSRRMMWTKGLFVGLVIYAIGTVVSLEVGVGVGLSFILLMDWSAAKYIR